MAVLKIRIELKRASRGVEMPKLADLARESQKLLRMVAEDTGIADDDGVWVAEDFYNQGVGFDATYHVADIDEPQAHVYTKTLQQIFSVESQSRWYVPGVRPATMVQSARLAKIADDDEVIRVGLYSDGGPAVSWTPLPKSRAEAIIEHFEEWVRYRGMIQGIIYEFHKESSPPFILVKDFATGQKAKCFYSREQYGDVVAALERKESTVLVSGWITARRSDRAIESIEMERIEPTKPLDERRLRQFFGSAPGWTGDLSTEDFISRVRETDDGD